MIGIIFLGIWMILIVLDIWSIKRDIKSIQWRISRLEWKDFGKSDEVDNGNE